MPSKGVLLKIDEEKLARIDEARVGTPRTVWIMEAVDERLSPIKAAGDVQRERGVSEEIVQAVEAAGPIEPEPSSTQATVEPVGPQVTLTRKERAEATRAEWRAIKPGKGGTFGGKA